MKKLIFLASSVLFLIAFSSCRRIVGKGPVESETRNISDFNRIQLDLGANVIYNPGPQFKVEVSAQKNLLDEVETVVIDSELKIRERRKNSWIKHANEITVTVTGPNVRGFNVSGSGDMKILQPVDQNEFSFRVTGSGNILASQVKAGTVNATVTGAGELRINSGEVTYSKLEVTGSGDIEFADLKSISAEARISGSGSIKVNVQDDLDCRISGSGDLYYRGTPRIKTSISGSGKIKPI